MLVGRQGSVQGKSEGSVSSKHEGSVSSKLEGQKRRSRPGCEGFCPHQCSPQGALWYRHPRRNSCEPHVWSGWHCFKVSSFFFIALTVTNPCRSSVSPLPVFVCSVCIVGADAMADHLEQEGIATNQSSSSFCASYCSSSLSYVMFLSFCACV